MGKPANESIPELEGEYLSVHEARRHLCGITSKAVRHHIVYGTKTPFGNIRLQARVLGGHYFTKLAWINEYLDLSTKARLAPVPNPMPDKALETPDEKAARYAEEQADLQQRLGNPSGPKRKRTPQLAGAEP